MTATEVEARVNAAPERVWEAWTDADAIARWFVDRMTGTVSEGAEIRWEWKDFGGFPARTAW